jgi:hypothetical protein
MAKYAPPGNTEVAWVTTMSSYLTPTASELNAGADLTSFITTMPTIPRTLNLVDVATLDSTYEKRQVGTRGGEQIDVPFLRDPAADTAYTTLAEDVVGYFVIARAGLATPGTFAIGDKVDVYPATVGSLEDGTPGRNDADFAVAHLVATNTPNRNYTIAS